MYEILNHCSYGNCGTHDNCIFYCRCFEKQNMLCRISPAAPIIGNYAGRFMDNEYFIGTPIYFIYSTDCYFCNLAV